MTPTDNEIDGILCNHWPAFRTLTLSVQQWVREAVREAIAKWGTPTPAGEPADVAALVKAAQAFVLEPESHKKKLELEALAWGPLAAPPVREPLTRERVKEIVREAGYDTEPVQHKADFINGIRHGERAHGITKGEPT